jgi:hypothetical protein
MHAACVQHLVVCECGPCWSYKAPESRQSHLEGFKCRRFSWSLDSVEKNHDSLQTTSE